LQLADLFLPFHSGMSKNVETLRKSHGNSVFKFLDGINSFWVILRESISKISIPVSHQLANFVQPLPTEALQFAILKTFP